MMRRNRIPYRVCGIFDTETCNIETDEGAIAYPVLFIYNDVSLHELYDYEADVTDRVTFYRREDEFIAKLEQVIAEAEDCIPVVCAYNLMFDLQPILASLADRHPMRAVAQSRTNAYTVDLMDEAEERVILRFWDTFHLEMNGLDAMGKVCGLEKASGSWDYSKIRTPDTELTEDELFYAKRDVQVIPAYLRYLLEANPWMGTDDLGFTILTKSSIVRQMAKREIGSLRVRKLNGKDVSLRHMFELTCAQELPPDFESYGIRRACFRGGFTYTSAAFASKVMHEVVSVDAVSMHHAFINGQRQPVHWMEADAKTLGAVCAEIAATPLETVLAHYDQPFLKYIHARIRFRNVRLKAGSVFERYGIALCPRGKFTLLAPLDASGEDNMRNVIAEDDLRALGYRDVATDAIFAFGKMYAARECILHMTELELWSFAQVYDFDAMEPLTGEVSIKSVLPPDYVTLQSNIFYKRKAAMKDVVARYRDGEAYNRHIDETIPKHMRDAIAAGEADSKFLEAYYQSTVKGGFNSVYGIQAQNIFRPDYLVTEDGELDIDDATRVTDATFEVKKPGHPTVMYTYGMRIVGGSRMHMVIAMMLIFSALGERALILGGDTDSMKIALDGASPSDVIDALAPLHDAVTKAIASCQRRVRDLYPEKAGELKGIGTFEIENEEPYPHHMECWNKARASIDAGGRFHVTMAGVARPRGAFHIETLANAMLDAGFAPEKVLETLMGYNVHVCYELSHSLERIIPRTRATVDADIRDYEGRVSHVSAHQSIALSETGRYIGDLSKPANMENVRFLHDFYGRPVDVRNRFVTFADGVFSVWVENERIFDVEA